MSIAKKFFGDKAFYKMVLAITVPIIIQNGITNFVTFLDNIMVGQLGAEALSGVGIANQMIFIYSLCLFGGLAGAGIFTAQFFGKNDQKGVQYTFRFKLLTAVAITVVGFCILVPFGDELISLFLTDTDPELDIELTLALGRDYLKVVLLSLIPLALTQVYSSTMRETGQTIVPMVASVIAVLTNALFNYLLIFGAMGFPELGVVGAAVGTIISRVVEFAIVVIWAHTHPKKVPYIKGVYSSLYIPRTLFCQMGVKTVPLLFNELMWSGGMTVLTQCYSTRGLVAVAAVNIATTISNLFNIVYISMGTAVAIVVGGQLGAGQIEEAKDTDRKIITFSILLCIGLGTFMALLAPAFTSIYKVSDDVKSLAATLIVIYAMLMPFHSFMHNCYFTLRSGGKTFITFLFDSAFIWGVNVPVGLILSRLTDIAILPLFISCVSVELIKCVIGAVLLKTGKWAHKLV